MKIAAYLLFFPILSFGQIKDDSIRMEVLINGVEDSLYVFGKWNEIDGTESHLKYLGTITDENDAYKIMTSCWIWGYSKRATNRILVYTENNIYLGNYYLDVRSQLPINISNNQLILLSKKNHGLTCNATFPYGIIKYIELDCDYGGVYLFDTIQ